MKKISIVLMCLMFMMPLSSLSVAEKDQTADNLEKDYFSVYELADFGQSARGVTVADFNDDGWMDFAVSYSTRPFNYSTISIFYNTKNLEFTREDVYTFSYGYIDSLSAGDFDNDGDIDLIFSYSQTRFNGYVRGVIEMLSNDGTNHFEEKSLISIRGLGFYFGFEKRIHPKITSADYDNDGDLDLLVGDNSGKLEFYKNNGKGRFRTQGIIFNYDVLSWGVASADFNNDDYLDVVVAAEDRRALGKIGHVFLKENTGLSNCFEKGRGSEIANPGGSSSMAALDYDNDGFMDILTGSSLSLYMNWDGGFQRFYMGRLYDNEGNPDCLRDGGLAAADFDKDGWTDIVAGGVHGIVRLFINEYQQFPPTEPSISGKDYQLEPDKKYVYNFTIADMNKDDVYLLVEWEDGTQSDWLGPFESGSTISLNHMWKEEGVFTFRAKSKDVYGAESGWRNCTVGVESKEVVLQQLDGDTLYVDDDGSADYTTIQDAVDAASEGDTVYVHSGIYHEQVVINKQISVIGENRDSTVIDCLEMNDQINNSAVVTIMSDNVVFSGFTVQSTIEERPLNGLYGISCDLNAKSPSDPKVIKQVIISNNFIVSDDSFPVEMRYPLRLDWVENSEISNNMVNGGDGGIDLYESSNNLVINNTVRNIDTYGINLGGKHSEGNLVKNNILKYNREGIALGQDSCDNVVILNSAKENNIGIITYYCDHNSITKNNLVDNTKNGFAFEDRIMDKYTNTWNQNYWGESLDQAVIKGKKYFFGIGLFPFPFKVYDMNPASEPFEIGGE